LWQSPEVLQQVLAALPVGVVVTNRAGDIVLANDAAGHVWGGPPIVSGAERRTRSKGVWHDTGKPIAPEEWASARALSDGQVRLNELLDIDAFDGQKKTIENSAVPIRDDRGGIVGAVIVNQDVTQRVRAEEALRESAQLLQHLSRRMLAVQEEERRHLSRELHDEFGQLLATITMQVHAAKALAGKRAQSRLDACVTLLQQAAAEVRNLALELRPLMLDVAGLDATLRWLAEQYQQRMEIPVKVTGHVSAVDGDPAIVVFRVVQEALTNVLRHAGARHVWIELSQSEGGVEVVVRDDGIGFDVAATYTQAGNRNRLGLLGMRERAELVGGRLDVESAPGRGTQIRVTLPAPGAGADAIAPAE
jgi:signal transduction histidine kinase